MQDIKKKLLEKGWKKSDINRTLKIIEKAKANKHHHIKILDKSVYWISLIIAIIGNFIISLSLIPLLLALKSFPLYLVLITIGISFGLLFELLIRTIENLETRHHIFLTVIIPLVAIINVFIIVLFSNRLEEIINIQNPQNPLIIGIVYAGAFIIPYAVYQLFLKK
ncbi:hypothetical protein CMO93_05215 [Candidatus Woesearchaeota archaeon]|jgi:hypothetical protein|nr:hypothetical protein [Candidatus Woesearchaeota archaeon]|tara:strand:- start:4163 stop:4660 length:498 start_codon:yes stop_codon:yes gene_type:complete